MGVRHQETVLSGLFGYVSVSLSVSGAPRTATPTESVVRGRDPRTRVVWVGTEDLWWSPGVEVSRSPVHPSDSVILLVSDLTRQVPKP